MNQLLNDLITTPIVLGIIAMTALLALIPLALLADVYNKKHPLDRNPFIIAVFATLITLLALSIGTLVRKTTVADNPFHYVMIQKTDKNVIITSKTMFIKSANLTVKENINNGVIVEHDGNEYVVRNDQLH